MGSKVGILTRTERIKAGLCRQCGQFPANPNRIHCSGCLNLAKHRSAIRQREFYAEIKEERRLYRQRLRREVIEFYGGKCVCCGETTFEFLTLDHIANDGAEHRRNVKTRDITQWARSHNYPTGLQVMCMNCNCAKSWYGECPHKTLKELKEQRNV